MQSTRKRHNLLEKLKDITNHLQQNKNLKSYCGIGDEFVHTFEAIQKDIRSKYWYLLFSLIPFFILLRLLYVCSFL